MRIENAISQERYSNNKRPTTTVTFRLDANTVKKLQTEAKDNDISLNTLVNQIMKRFVEWDAFESKVGMVLVAKPVVAELFAKMTKDQVIDLATRIGKSAIRDISLFMKGELSVTSFLSWLEARMRTCSQVNYQQENGVKKYIFRHELGENWSLYHKTIADLIFAESLSRAIDIEMSNTMLIFTIHDL